MFVIVLFSAVGALCIASGIQGVRVRQILKRDGVSAVGRVYQLDQRTRDGNVLYTPLIVFSDENGVEHRFESPRSSSRVPHPLGSEVPLRYLRSRPDIVDIDTRNHKVTLTLLPFSGGIIFLAVAALAVKEDFF